MRTGVVRALGSAAIVGGMVAVTALPAAAWTQDGTRNCTISQTAWASGTGTQYVTTRGPGRSSGRSVFASASHTVTEKGISGGGYWRVDITGTAQAASAYCTSGS